MISAMDVRLGQGSHHFLDIANATSSRKTPHGVFAAIEPQPLGQEGLPLEMQDRGR